MKYQLKAALTAIVSESRGTTGACTLVTVEAGDEITLVGPIRTDGLVEGLYKGEHVTMFQTDIQQRAERIEDTSA